MGLEEVKLSLCIDDWKPQRFHTKNIARINELSKGYRANTKISCTFITNDDQYEKEIKKTVPFPVVSKRIKYLGIN